MPSSDCIHSIFARLQLWLERTRERRLLARLDDRALADMGVSRCDALAEAGKPFWRG